MRCARTARDLDKALGDIRMRGELAGRAGGLRVREAQGCEARDFLRGRPASVKGMAGWAATGGRLRGEERQGGSVVRRVRGTHRSDVPDEKTRELRGRCARAASPPLLTPFWGSGPVSSSPRPPANALDLLDRTGLPAPPLAQDRSLALTLTL